MPMEDIEEITGETDSEEVGLYDFDAGEGAAEESKTRITEGLLPKVNTIGDGVNVRESYAVSLEMFEGPLDLLLHPVRRHELDILGITGGDRTDGFAR